VCALTHIENVKKTFVVYMRCCEEYSYLEFLEEVILGLHVPMRNTGTRARVHSGTGEGVGSVAVVALNGTLCTDHSSLNFIISTHHRTF
jgi:hypothetical protein